MIELKLSTSLKEGRPHPRGGTLDGKGTNFSVFSAHATKVEVCIFDGSGERELERIELPEYTNQIWHGYLPDVHPGTPYGFRVHGPYEPDAGHRFNPNKLLLDPYAYAHMGDLKWNPALVDYLKCLSVMSVELLPSHTFINDSYLIEKGLANYWGYNSIGFFAPDPRYSAAPAECLREFKEMVARLHEAGLEVILDVVYNHTAEGNERGPTLSV